MQLILYMATTVNGYIADEDGETPWSQAVWESYYRLAKEFKAIIVGRKTYEVMQEVDEFKKIGSPFTLVVTNKSLRANPNITIVKSPQAALSILKEKNYTRVLIGGGGQLNASFMKEKLIDQLILDIEPLIFGQGIKLFEGEDFKAQLELQETKNLSKNTIQLRYKVLK